MAEATLSLLPSLLTFLLLFLLSSDTQVQGFKHKSVFSISKVKWKQLKHVSKCSPHKSRREKDAMVLEMKQRDYCSGNIKNWDETLQSRLISDDNRVKFLLNRASKSKSAARTQAALDAEIPLTSGAQLQTLNYIVPIELGGKQMAVVVDTGSDLTWIQCQPCVSCYDQREPLFNPNASRSYRTIKCNSNNCKSLADATGNSGVCGADRRTCNYIVTYGDGSYSRGNLGREYLSLGGMVLSKFIFGCGRDNDGLFGEVSGLMGLGRSRLSLISQTSGKYGGVFSYCLPSDTQASGSLTFGRNFSDFKNSTPIVYTNMVSNPQLSTFYVLNLTGMSVGGVELQATGFSNGEILIDSGTIVTRLVPSVYKALKAEFLKQFSGYPTAPPFSILDTCFNLSTYEEVDIPTLRFRFGGGVEMTVDVMGMLYFITTDASQVCLALASLTYEDEIGIIGNYQQKNQRVVYDTKKSKLGFAEEICNYT